MPHSVPWKVAVQSHPGSTDEDIRNEPNTYHEHRIGYRNQQGRFPGFTHDSDEKDDNDEYKYDERAKQDYKDLETRAKRGDLINWADLVKSEHDIHLKYPRDKSLGWRFVLQATEDWVRNEQDWPANLAKRQHEKEQQESRATSEGERSAGEQRDGGEQNEHDQKRSENNDNEKHHDAYGLVNQEHSNGDDHLLDKYSPQELALLRCLQHEKDYRQSLQENDGTRLSPQKHNRSTVTIDEQDQFTPDNFVTRSSDLIRLTGKHPLNAEIDLTKLFQCGLITPNELHYVRNHGAVPRLFWEFHKLDVENGKLMLCMNDLRDNFKAINIPVSLACDGNRRKELNLIKRSKGFNWGAAATGCAWWKGALLRDVLVAAGIEQSEDGAQKWVNFAGADECSEGPYETCIPLSVAMNVTADVLLAYGMNDLPLPPDHGYPLRVIIPGYVGGRCVKWLSKIWITDSENKSYYHIWDNRVVPGFVTEKDGPFAEALFSNPSTACNEQNLNSVIAKPSHGERLSLSNNSADSTYRIEGYAYDGGGHEVQRVEVSLDRGSTWLYCVRTFPEYPIRHGNKFWTWLHWHVDVCVGHLVRAESISVRAWNVFKNTQPREPNWNIMGMMNNSWYVVKPEIQSEPDHLAIVFRHPAQPGTDDGGWMKPSEQVKLAAAKQSASAPSKQFTRQEVEKHVSEQDCWIVVDGKVYDATSVLAWHPGGKSAIMNHAGKLHQATTDEFSSVHDDYAYQKLQQCALGVLTDRGAQYIKTSAEEAAKQKAADSKISDKVVLQSHRWVPVTLIEKRNLSEDTRAFTFRLPDGQNDLGLGTCQHVQIGFHLKDKMLVRSYTPTRPISKSGNLMQSSNQDVTKSANSLADGQGSFELVVKVYLPTTDQPGGAMSNILDNIPIGEQVEIRGPTGDIEYKGRSKFVISGKEQSIRKINLIVGGSGLTPAWALLARAVTEEHDVRIKVIDANKSEADILLHQDLDRLERESGGRLEIVHVLSHATSEWNGLKGHVNEDIVKTHLFPPGEDVACFLCGPPSMIQKAAIPALTAWGFEHDRNIFGF